VNKSILLLILVLSLLLYDVPLMAADDCQTDERIHIFYVNGMNNDISKASKSAEAIKNKLFWYTNSIKVNLAYQADENDMDEILEAAIQMGIDDYSAFWRWLADIESAPQWFKDKVLDLAAEADEFTYVNDMDLQSHVGEYLSAIDAGEKVVLVGHSQGNFYANRAWSYIDSAYGNKSESIGVVGVATPATYVAGSGPYVDLYGHEPYTTLTNDVVIWFLRNYVNPLIKTPTNTNINLADLSGHAFINSYLGTSGLQSQIKSHILNVADITNNCPIPCGSSVSASGGKNGFTDQVELGTEGGKVQLEFEAYFIPDQIQVFASNPDHTLLESTNGLVSGFYSFEFDFDSVALGTSQVDVVVTGNNNPDTLWTFTLGCPGQIISNADREVDRRILSFVFGDDFPLPNTECKFDFYIDGNRKASTGDEYKSYFNFTTSLTKGKHTYSYKNSSCQKTIFRDPYPTYYQYYFDSTQHGIYSPLNSGVYMLEVQ